MMVLKYQRIQSMIARQIFVRNLRKSTRALFVIRVRFDVLWCALVFDNGSYNSIRIALNGTRYSHIF